MMHRVASNVPLRLCPWTTRNRSAELPAANQQAGHNEGSTWTGNRDATIPQADSTGRVKGATVSERLEAIRRRSVDANISRPFMVVDPRQSESMTVEHQGELPAVPKRSLNPQLPATVETTGQSATTVESPTPTPADKPEPSLATPSNTSRAPATMPSYNHSQPHSAASLPTVQMANGDDMLLTKRAPAISFETTGPRHVIIGKEASYHIDMINTGDVAGQNLVVSVELPAWAEVVSNSASVGSPQLETGEDQSSIVRWTLESLEARSREKLTLHVVPRDSRPFDLAVGWAFSPKHTTAQIEVQEPKLEMAIDGPDEVLYGETEVYKITITNPGTGDAEQVVLNLLPVSSQSQIAGSRNIGTIRAGERKTVELELTAHQAGRLQVSAMAYADGGLRTETAQEVIVRRANLEVAVAGPPRNFAATEAVYRIRLENTGDASANDCRVTVALPAGAKYVSSTDGGKYDAERGQVSWPVGVLRSAAVRVLELECELHSAGDNRFDVQCEATNDLRVARSIVTRVEALADLKLFVNDPKGAIEVGQDAFYEVKVVNRGTKSAEMVQIVGYFSEGIEPISVLGWRGETSTGQVVMDPIGTIAPGQEISFRITARATLPGNHVFRTELQCSSPETRLAAEEWTKYYSQSSLNEVQQAAVPMSPGPTTGALRLDQGERR